MTGRNHTAEPTLADKRREFALVLEHAPLDVLVTAMRNACQLGFGTWQDPTPTSAAQSTAARPATHLFEISFLGLESRGFTPAEAARNWRIAVLNQIAASDAASDGASEQDAA